MLDLVTSNERVCMFCGQKLLNRGEAYYDHIVGTAACHEAWVAWTEQLNADWAGGD